VPSEIERVKMVDDGRMLRALEQLREQWEARGIVEYDAVIDAVIAREEFVAHTPSTD
jgi:hypothetical protein